MQCAPIYVQLQFAKPFVCCELVCCRRLVHALSPGGAHELGTEDGVGGAGREPAEPEAAASTIGPAPMLGTKSTTKTNGCTVISHQITARLLDLSVAILLLYTTDRHFAISLVCFDSLIDYSSRD